MFFLCLIMCEYFIYDINMSISKFQAGTSTLPVSPPPSTFFHMSSSFIYFPIPLLSHALPSSLSILSLSLIFMYFSIHFSLSHTYTHPIFLIFVLSLLSLSLPFYFCFSCLFLSNQLYTCRKRLDPWVDYRRFPSDVTLNLHCKDRNYFSNCR